MKPCSISAEPGASPQGQITIGSHISLAPTWFDPAETAGIITPFMMLYALHDAMLKAMPGNAMAPCLAEACTVAGFAVERSEWAEPQTGVY